MSKLQSDPVPKFDNAHWTSQHLTSFRGRLMRTFRSVTLLFLIIVSVSLAQRGTARVTVYEGARLITGDGAAIENSAFIVDGSQFTRVGRRGEVQVPANAQQVNLTGKTVMPAKVDLHGHFGYQHDWDGTMAKEYFTRENLIDHLQRLAYYGFSGTAAGLTGVMCRCGCVMKSLREQRCFERPVRESRGQVRERTAILHEPTCRIRSPRLKKRARRFETTSRSNPSSSRSGWMTEAAA